MFSLTEESLTFDTLYLEIEQKLRVKKARRQKCTQS